MLSHKGQFCGLQHVTKYEHVVNKKKCVVKQAHSLCTENLNACNNTRDLGVIINNFVGWITHIGNRVDMPHVNLSSESSD